jgi:carbonic anhydrase
MKATITYHDNESLTIEEVVAQAIKNYGSAVQVEITPESNLAYDYIYFGLQQLITHSQMSLLFEKNVNYQTELKKLREGIVYKVTEIIDQVIIDNEARVE